MAEKPTSKRGYAPASIANRFQKNQSGNPAGRPRKEASATEALSTNDIIARVARTKVQVQGENGVREINYVDALISQLASAGLKTPRDGFRMLHLIIANESSSSHSTAHPEAEPGELLDDPIVKRAVEREMRRLLRQQGEDDAAAELMREQFGLADDEHNASTGGDDDGE